jgi:hypothetical protein
LGLNPTYQLNQETLQTALVRETPVTSWGAASAASSSSEEVPTLTRDEQSSCSAVILMDIWPEILSHVSGYQAFPITGSRVALTLANRWVR